MTQCCHISPDRISQKRIDVKMVESRCGILCSKCEYQEKMNCKGCIAIDRPFWGDSCPVKSCCEEQKHNHCGECTDFPCPLLIEFAYDEKEGDNGKRIETCRYWAKTHVFDTAKFLKDVVTQNANDLPKHFTPNAVICWHCSNEQLTVDEYVRANCEYPGKWEGTVERTEKIEDGMIIVSNIIPKLTTTIVKAYNIKVFVLQS